ncbi:MAG: hypothetical protein AAGF07_03060 [Patescibacteria group bacterium]
MDNLDKVGLTLSQVQEVTDLLKVARPETILSEESVEICKNKAETEFKLKHGYNPHSYTSVESYRENCLVLATFVAIVSSTIITLGFIRDAKAFIATAVTSGSTVIALGEKKLKNDRKQYDKNLEKILVTQILQENKQEEH